MLESLIRFSLKQQVIIFLGVILLVVLGVYSFTVLPVEAFPDVLNETVQVITQVPGQSAEDVEKKVTRPLEREFTGIPKVIQSRSVSEFGLSVIYLYFDDGVDKYWARTQVLEKIGTANLPSSFQPSLAPMSSVTGEILRYELRSPQLNDIQLRELQDWTLEKQFRSIPGVADVVSFGGKVKAWDVLADPLKMNNYGVNLRQLFDAIQNSNVNAGGNMIHWPSQSFVVRSEGEYRNHSDIEHVGLVSRGDSIIAVRDVASVIDSYLPFRGVVGRDDRDNIVEGIVLLRKGENPVVVGKAVEDRVKELNSSNILPENVKLHVYYDRMKLVENTTSTVWKNLGEGLILVILILMIFLKDFRATFIVALVVPLSLMFAFGMIVLFHTPANLISLGAIDFGMVVDGAVLIVESVLAQWQKAKHSNSFHPNLETTVATIIKPVFFSMIMIIIAYTPIFTLQRVEGKMFSPLAWTVCFTLAGALILSLMLIPALLPWLQKKFENSPAHEEPRWFIKTKDWYLKNLDWFMQRPKLALQVILTVLLLSGVTIYFSGTEFLPELDESALWIRVSFPHSTSLQEGQILAKEIRKIIKSYEETNTVVSQLGGPEDGTDPNLFDNCEFFVDLKQKNKWKRFHNDREELIDNLRQDLERIPGIEFNISQPIADNVEEAISGVKGKNAAKIYGPDLAVLKKISNELSQILKSVAGTSDVGVTASTPMIPQLTVTVDRTKVAQAGLNLQDVNDLIEIAVGGKTVTQVYEGEIKIDVIVRAPEQYRDSLENIRRLPLTLPGGKRILLEQVAEVKMKEGPQAVFRENGSRRIAVKFNVSGRDLGSVMSDIFEKMKSYKVPTGYQVIWGGEYENQQRAMQRMAVAVPLTILVLGLVLFFVLKRVSLVGLVLFNMLLSCSGGIILLFLRRIPFSVSAGVGLLALFGVVALNSVTLMSRFESERLLGSLHETVTRICDDLFRPILMTATLAALAILPAALSHGMGSETQRPLATMVIGGLLTALPSTLLLLPTLAYYSEMKGLRNLIVEAFRSIRRPKKSVSK